MPIVHLDIIQDLRYTRNSNTVAIQKMEKENMPPDGNDNKFNSDTNNDNNLTFGETGEKIQYVGSVIEKGDETVYGNDKDNAETDKDDDDDEEPLFEDSFSTPPPEEESEEEEPPQEQQESSHQSLVVSPIKGSNSSNKNDLSSSSTSTLSLSSLELIIPSFVVAGFQRKASSILMLKSWIQLSLSLDGRDKITKCTLTKKRDKTGVDLGLIVVVVGGGRQSTVALFRCALGT